MKTLSETVLSVIPGSDDHTRLLVVLRQVPKEGSRLELRQQSWGEGLGWFTQSTIPLESSQVAELRAALGGGVTSRPQREPAVRSRSANSFCPRIVRADSA